MEQLNNLTSTQTCPHHGDFLSTGTQWLLREGSDPIVHWSKCAACLIQRERDAEERARIEAERKVERDAVAARRDLQRRLVDSGIPSKFRTKRLCDYTSDSPGQREALRTCVAYVECFDDVYKDGRNLLFIGKVGCGKTHLACALGLEVLEAGGTVRYTTAADMVRRFTDTWRNRDGETESDVLADLGSADLLILDEAGEERGSEISLSKISQVIDRRYRESLPNIVISNLGVEKLKPFMGDRVMDRLRDGGSQLIAFDWSSYRGRRAVA